MGIAEEAKKFSGLTASDAGLLARVLVLVLAVRVTLLLRPTHRAEAIASRITTSLFGPDEDLSGDRIIWAVRAVTRRFILDKPCLSQAIAVRELFHHMGYPAEMKVGVDKPSPNELRAHAWVVSDDEIVIGGKKSPYRYKTLQREDPETR